MGIWIIFFGIGWWLACAIVQAKLRSVRRKQESQRRLAEKLQQYEQRAFEWEQKMMGMGRN